MSGYHCSTCGEHHDELPFAYGTDAPAQWYDIPKSQRRRRTRLSSDQCILDKQYFFIKGNIELPVVGHATVFNWTVWVSLSEANFARCQALWKTIGRESEPPYFGWLATSLPLYPDTMNLKTDVHTRPVGERPLIELQPCDHPLALEQANGIPLSRVREIAEAMAHRAR